MTVQEAAPGQVEVRRAPYMLPAKIKVVNDQNETVCFKFRTNYPNILTATPRMFNLNAGESLESTMGLSKESMALSWRALKAVSPLVKVFAWPLADFHDADEMWASVPLSKSDVPSATLQLDIVVPTDSGDGTDDVAIDTGNQTPLKESPVAAAPEGEKTYSEECSGKSTPYSYSSEDTQGSSVDEVNEHRRSESTYVVSEITESETLEELSILRMIFYSAFVLGLWLLFESLFVQNLFE
ncbi:unnamed protein product [Soboliphyme baturini]|uniref:MSP domain-containing protein n=1 Tax=Soboliphyme baturini TaxID=241478 RepID=A0A183J889_9BILA|nr:unnamed protein product [Soboliphyme baturini]